MLERGRKRATSDEGLLCHQEPGDSQEWLSHPSSQRGGEQERGRDANLVWRKRLPPRVFFVRVANKELTGDAACKSGK